MRNGDGKTILLRAELDALPIEEQTGLIYASKARMKGREGRNQPVMHAWGHDVHITCVLATLRLLRSAVQYWSGTVVAVFQPDEETPTSAQAMIDDGLYPLCPRPDVMLAQHVGMSKAGLVAVWTGPVLPASDYLELTLVSSGPGANLPERPDPVNLGARLLDPVPGDDGNGYRQRDVLLAGVSRSARWPTWGLLYQPLGNEAGDQDNRGEHA